MFAINSEYALENAPCGFISFYADGTIVQINKTLLKWLSYTSEEVVFKKKFSEILNTGGRLYFQMFISPQLNMQDHINEISLSFVSSNNTSISCLFKASVIRNEDKTIQLIHASVFNITDRKKYEVEILKAKTQAEEEKKRFEFLANALPTILWRATPAGKINFLNDRFFEYFNCTTEQTGLAFLRSTFLPADLRPTLESWKKAMQEENEVQFELCLKNNQGKSNWFFVRIIPYKDPAGKLLMWLGTCTDIHEQKEKQLGILKNLSIELSEASSDIEHKTKILKEVAFTQSHLVRSPVSKILGLGSLLKKHDMGDGAKHVISLLIESAQQLDGVISEILNKSKTVRE